MRTHSPLSQSDFDDLLGWLAPDREEAGVKYENIRERLVRFFQFRGCSVPVDLADETINRVASKVSGITLDPGTKEISLFYGFASKIFLEYTTRRKNREVSIDENFQAELTETAYAPDERKDEEFDCLDRCLRNIDQTERVMILKYYSEEKTQRMKMRKEMANQLNMNAGTLHTRAYRLRQSLRLCIENCLGGR